jgi:hypothetical protein
MLCYVVKVSHSNFGRISSLLMAVCLAEPSLIAMVNIRTVKGSTRQALDLFRELCIF